MQEYTEEMMKGSVKTAENILSYLKWRQSRGDSLESAVEYIQNNVVAVANLSKEAFKDSLLIHILTEGAAGEFKKQ